MTFDEAKTLYQFLVKSCHPDMGPAVERLQRTTWMKEINEAYTLNDLARLKRIATEVLAGPTKQSATPPPHRPDQTSARPKPNHEQQAKAREKADRDRAKAAADRAGAQAAADRAKAQEEADRAAGDVMARRQRDIIQQRDKDRLQNLQVVASSRQLLKKKRFWVTAFVVGGMASWGLSALPNGLEEMKSTITVTPTAAQPITSLDQRTLQALLNPKTPTPDRSTRSAPAELKSFGFVKVSTPSGMGVYLRNTVSWEDKGQVLPEGQLLEVLEMDVQGEGRSWHYVRVPESGQKGYVPVEFVTF